MENPDKLAA